MSQTHHYELEVTWTGNTGTGTSGFRDFERSHEISAPGKPVILASADTGAAFRGSPDRWNPEELLVAALSQCHMLWYLYLCSQEGVVVTAYVDRPHGTMSQKPDGSGQFEEVVLRPEVSVAPSDREALAVSLHQRAHEMCFIANSVNFPVRNEPAVNAID
jgi:organic hydroperoxide reductase OsmC/OhrA